MKTLTIKRTITVNLPEGQEPNMKEIVDSLNRAVRIWGLVKGLDLGDGKLEFDIRTPRVKKAKKVA